MWDWWGSDLSTRLKPSGVMVIIGTRWHLDDIIGRVMAAEKQKGGDKWDKVILPALELVTLEGFLALIPAAPSADLQDLAAEVVRALDPYRAPLSPAEIARRRPELLTTRQRELLGIYGYPYVMEQFQFHLTLSGALAADQTAQARAAAQSHFAGVVPQPFVIADLCLCGEDDLGQFHLMHRYPLMA
jgi:hypothetical protein